MANILKHIKRIAKKAFLAFKGRTRYSVELQLRDAYNSISMNYLDDHKPDEALKYINKAIQLCEKTWGEYNKELAVSFALKARAYELKADYDKALEYYKREMVIRERELGEEHPDTATTYNNMAGVYRCLRKYDDALDY